ncbi:MULTISPECIES: NlpC/P60 family protein [Loigolactobacillus]|uniref:C40 family peptidase n=1 Tax=Loigolactobacillus TaxID=2767889 RepID=UPI0009ED9788|nr:NlpC/P60 family protein [Loigolactobacillus backii]
MFYKQTLFIGLATVIVGMGLAVGPEIKGGTVGATYNVQAAVQNGYDSNGIFYQSGKKASGYLNDGKNWYLFKNGVKQSQIQKWSGYYYYFDPTSHLRSDNVFRNEWGNTYYFGSNGQAVSGLQKINGKEYYFGEDGTFNLRKNTFFKTKSGKTYYAGADGALLTDVQKINGTYYYFDHSNYQMHTNSYDKSNWGDWYMFGSDGKIKTGWQNWAGSTYYFSPTTYLKVTGVQVISGVAYKFDSTGKYLGNNNALKVVNLAKQLTQQHIPYVWGGASLSGMDCSGLVAYVFQHAIGKTLPHYTVSLESAVNQKSVAQAQPGDLLFWGNHGQTYHVAIYIGNHQFVAAPQSGEDVQVQTISSYFMPSFAGTVK